MKRESVGIVGTQCYRIPEEIALEHGDPLSGANVVYETYGKLNKEKSNAILVCHALSGDAHAGGWHKGEEKPGWWDIIIGPGKALDTDKFFVICSNVLGGCKGTTGLLPSTPRLGNLTVWTFRSSQLRIWWMFRRSSLTIWELTSSLP